jgi:hypothetical protein
MFLFSFSFYFIVTYLKFIDIPRGLLGRFVRSSSTSKKKRETTSIIIKTLKKKQKNTCISSLLLNIIIKIDSSTAKQVLRTIMKKNGNIFYS